MVQASPPSQGSPSPQERQAGGAGAVAKAIIIGIAVGAAHTQAFTTSSIASVAIIASGSPPRRVSERAWVVGAADTIEHRYPGRCRRKRNWSPIVDGADVAVITGAAVARKRQVGAGVQALAIRSASASMVVALLAPGWRTDIFQSTLLLSVSLPSRYRATFRFQHGVVVGIGQGRRCPGVRRAGVLCS